jgi:hypothetical protein
MSADSDAFRAVQQLPGLSLAEQQYLLTVSRGEGFYGLGWGNPNKTTIAESEKFGIDPRAGVGSNNWGAEQGSGSAGFFPHVDTHADGTFYVGKYKRHATPTEGAASIARILLKPNVRLALKTGVYVGQRRPLLANKQLTPLEAAVLSQYENRYFELDPAKYTEAVKKNYAILTSNLKWPSLLLQEMVDGLPLDPSTLGFQSSGLLDSSSGEPSESQEPEGGIIRGQKYCVPGIQDKDYGKA